MSKSNAAENINRQTMRQSVDEYSVYEELNAPEKRVFDAVSDEVRNKPILDLGVGGGRTTAALLKISGDYLGVDYVPEMVSACQSRFPGVRFAHADARSMPQFPDRSFKLIVFACNGVSMVDHAGRIAIFKEVRRLLAPDGIFVFSTYNTNSSEYERWFEFPEFAYTHNVVKLAVRTARFALHSVRGLINRLRYLRHEVRTAEYSIINDRCHHYATMLYYISIENQLEQLQRMGFDKKPDIYDTLGTPVGASSRSDSLTYMVRA